MTCHAMTDRLNWLILSFLFLLVATSGQIRADGPGDNVPNKVRPVPPPGVEVPKADREELEQGLAAWATRSSN